MGKKSSVQRFEKHLRSWDHHHVMNNYSVTPHEGVQAIIHPCVVGEVGDIESHTNGVMLENFEREAHQIATELGYVGMRSLILAGISYATFDRALADPKISDIIVIGNGDFTSVYSDESTSDVNRFITWSDVGSMTKHLKRGTFTQRTCGKSLEDNRLSPPLGLFAVSDHRSIYSPVNDYFKVDDYEDIDSITYEEAKIRQVSSVERVTLDYANAHFRDSERQA